MSKRKYTKAHRDKLRKNRIIANKQILNCQYCQRNISMLNLKRHEKACRQNPDYKPSSYIEICFQFHKRKCVCCNERRVIDVHHLDSNRENNSPDNLIPLCPNHHRYIHHSKYRFLIEQKVLQYVELFKETFTRG